MSADDLLIDQALAAIAAAPQPLRLGAQIKITPEQALVLGVYEAQKATLTGLGDFVDVERDLRAASRAGIAQHELDAAIARANADCEQRRR